MKVKLSGGFNSNVPDSDLNSRELGTFENYKEIMTEIARYCLDEFSHSCNDTDIQEVIVTRNKKLFQAKVTSTDNKVSLINFITEEILD